MFFESGDNGFNMNTATITGNTVRETTMFHFNKDTCILSGITFSGNTIQ